MYQITYYHYRCSTVKYDRDGNQLWSRRFGDGSVAFDVTIDSQNNIVADGSNVPKYSNQDYYIIKLMKMEMRFGRGDTMWVYRIILMLFSIILYRPQQLLLQHRSIETRVMLIKIL